MAPMAEAKKSRTRLWFALHGWIALPIWLFLFFVCITGTIATVDKEIMWLLDPTVRASHADGARRLPLNAVVEAVKRQIPGVYVANIRFGEPFMALEMSVSTPDMPRATAWVNPYSGEVQRVATGIGFSSFLKALHGWLLMPWQGAAPIGWYLVCLMGLPLLGSVITGLVVYKRFWMAFIRPRLRIGKGSRVFWGDLHRLAGVWGAWFVALIALTGLWFLVVGILYDLHVPLGVEDPDIPRREAPAHAAGTPLPSIDLDGALATVRALRPGATPLAVVPPEHALGTISVYSRSAFPLLVEEAWVHPYSGDVVGLYDFEVAATHHVVSSLNSSLHYGNFGGIWVKLVWTTFGLLLSGLVFSGFLIWTKRTAQATRAALAPHPAQVPAAEGAK